MKKYVVYATGLVLLIVVACTKTKTTAEKNIPASNPLYSSGNSMKNNSNSLLPVFNRWVGGPIDGDLGRKWIANRLKLYRPYSYMLTAKAIQHILDQPGCIGISFYYAMDGNTMHILPYGVDENGRIIKTSTVPTEKDEIKWEVAAEWRAAYTGVVKAHFWGANSFIRLIDEEKSTWLRFTAALRDDGKVELLISNAEEEMPKRFQDQSGSCPPYCPFS